MSKYTPDRWVVIEFDYNGQTTKKVFGGWYGGFMTGDSWKLSSGVTNQREFEDRFEFENYSGSLYTCYKGAYGMSGYMSGIFSGFEKQVEESDNVSMKILEEYNVQTGT